MKKAVLICSLMMAGSLVGCGAEQEMISTDRIVGNSYEKVDNLWSTFEIQEGLLEENETNIGAFCVYDGSMVYEVNYQDSLVSQTGEVANIPFEEKYNTELRRMNLSTGEDELLYKYNRDNCVDVTDITYNGEHLVWETLEESWKLSMLSLESGTVTEMLTDGVENGGDLSEVILNLTTQDLYWYDKNGSEANCITLYRRNLSEKKTEVYRAGLDLISPYTKPAMIGSICTAFSRNVDGTNGILQKDMVSGKEKTIVVDMEVCNPLGNDKYCVWTKGYDTNSEIYVYDADAQQVEVISLGEARAFSYALLGEYLLVNQRSESQYGAEGLYCFHLAEKKYSLLEGLEDKTILYTHQGVDGNVYFQLADETADFRVMNISLKRD